MPISEVPPKYRPAMLFHRRKKVISQTTRRIQGSEKSKISATSKSHAAMQIDSRSHCFLTTKTVQKGAFRVGGPTKVAPHKTEAETTKMRFA